MKEDKKGIETLRDPMAQRIEFAVKEKALEFAENLFLKGISDEIILDSLKISPVELQEIKEKYAKD